MTKVSAINIVMVQVTTIHSDKEPIRVHYIAEWAEARNLSPTDIVKEVGADKSLVSRWLNEGVVPGKKYLPKLAALFATDVHGIFRHPDDDWLARFFREKNEEERDRVRQLLEAAFPELRKTG